MGKFQVMSPLVVTLLMAAMHQLSCSTVRSDSSNSTEPSLLSGTAPQNSTELTLAAKHHSNTTTAHSELRNSTEPFRLSSTVHPPKIPCKDVSDCAAVNESICWKNQCRCKIGKTLRGGSRNGTGSCVTVHCNTQNDCHKSLDDDRVSLIACNGDTWMCVCVSGHHFSADNSTCALDIGAHVLQIFFWLGGILLVVGLVLCCGLCICYCCKQVYEEHHRSYTCKSNLANARSNMSLAKISAGKGQNSSSRNKK